jgi:hypothetical protein
LTLQDSIDLLRSRFDVDLDGDTDLSVNKTATTEIMNAAEQVSRDTYFLWTWQSALTLTDQTTEYNCLSASISASKVFHVYGVHINDGWLDELTAEEFLNKYPDYQKSGSGYESSTPAHWVPTAPSHIKIAVRPNATAVAATDNFIMGFRLHATYTYDNETAGLSKSASLEGPEEYHDMIVDKAFLNNSKSYITSESAWKRRMVVKAEYDELRKIKIKENMNRYRKLRRKPDAGLESGRVFQLG